MNRDSNVVFEGSIPENYDRYLGPVFFEPSARDLIGRLSGKQLHSVLELACGTGILTRMLRDSLLPSTNIVATDLNPGMIAFAKNKFRSEENVEWKEADASALPFPDKSFDAVICQYGLMFVPEKDAAMREAYRVLKPGAAFLFNVWDAIDRNPAARTAHETISSFFESDPPTFYELPFNMHDVGLVRELLQKAGFKSIDSRHEWWMIRYDALRTRGAS